MRTFARSGLWLLFAAGCTTIYVQDDDDDAASSSAGASSSMSITTSTSSASSTSGTGGVGGEDPGPRMITVELLADAETLDAAHVLVNDEDGTLRQALHGSELPTDVEVVDTQLVTFVVPGDQVLFRSFRVTPGVTSIVVGSQPVAPPPCEVEPMTVIVSFAEVPGATAQMAQVTAGFSSVTSAPGTKILTVQTCEPSFDLLAWSRNAGVILGYELFQGIPFVAGGTLDLTTTTSSTERAAREITLTGLADATSAQPRAQWDVWPVLVPIENVGTAFLDPPATLQWSATPILPGPDGYGETSVSLLVDFTAAPGQCSRGAGVTVREPAPGTVTTLDVSGLAPIAAVGETGWTLTAGGGLGDSVWVSMTLGDQATAPLWYLLEDPSFPTSGPVFPVLPPDLPSELAPPTTTPTLYSVGHQDHAASSYADFISTPDSITPYYAFVNAVYDCP